MAPKVGPMRGMPYAVATAMPQTIRPGCNSPVIWTTPSSDETISMGPNVFASSIPLFLRDSTTWASWPVASITIFDSMAMGSTQVMALGRAETGVQFMTTPETFPFLYMQSSNFVMLMILAPASQAEAMSLEH